MKRTLDHKNPYHNVLQVGGPSCRMKPPVRGIAEYVFQQGQGALWKAEPVSDGGNPTLNKRETHVKAYIDWAF